MKRYTLLHLIAIAVLLIISMDSAASVSDSNNKIPSRITMSKEMLLDKIKGAWAGQVIGCTYGGPTEFVYRGRMIEEEKEIPW